MGKPYSRDLRERIIDYISAGHSCRAAGRVFGVSASTAVRLATDYKDRGNVTPRRQGRAPGTVGKLAAYTGFLIKQVQANPDITLRELGLALEEAHGVVVQLSSIHRALEREGYSYKKRIDRTGAPAPGTQAGTA